MMDEATAGETTGGTASAGAGEYRVRVARFEGPLDLLLHLVRINEVDIADIPIIEITRQYNEFLDLMREFNLDVAGEYLVMAATLMHIKSRMLLPADPSIPEGEREDPRRGLMQQLAEYERFKQAAENLQAIDAARALVWTRDGKVPDEFADEELLAVDLIDLISAFRTLLGRIDDETRLHLRRDDVSVADKIGWLTDLLDERPSLDLLEVLRGLASRIERIATFLALLEMLRLRMVVAFQAGRLGEIRIARREDVAPAGGAFDPLPDSQEGERP